VQLVHIPSNAVTIDDAGAGVIFMQEMIEFMKIANSLENSVNQYLPLSVIPLLLPALEKPISLTVATAQFGKQLHGTEGVNNLFYDQINSYFLLF
jgi:hypothetical protein